MPGRNTLCSQTHVYLKHHPKWNKSGPWQWHFEINTLLCFLNPWEPVEPLDEELPVVEQLLDIWLLERYPALLPYTILSLPEGGKGKFKQCPKSKIEDQIVALDFIISWNWWREVNIVNASYYMIPATLVLLVATLSWKLLNLTKSLINSLN